MLSSIVVWIKYWYTKLTKSFNQSYLWTVFSRRGWGVRLWSSPCCSNQNGTWTGLISNTIWILFSNLQQEVTKWLLLITKMEQRWHLFACPLGRNTAVRGNQPAKAKVAMRQDDSQKVKRRPFPKYANFLEMKENFTASESGERSDDLKFLSSLHLKK